MKKPRKFMNKSYEDGWRDAMRVIKERRDYWAKHDPYRLLAINIVSELDFILRHTKLTKSVNRRPS